MNEDAMQIRQERVGDVSAVMELVARVVPIMRASGNLQWDDEYPNAAVFERDAEMGQLWVDSEFRGKGIAAALMLQAEVVARTRSISVLRIATNTSNEATQKLFPKLGYELAGEIALGFRPGLRFRCYEKRLV